MKNEKNKSNFIYKTLNHYLYPACLFFTLSVLIISFIVSITSQSAIAPTPSFLLMILLFSFFIAFINRIFYKQLNSVLKVTLHFIGSITGFSVVFIGISGYYKNGSTALFIVFFASMVYVILLTVTMIIKNILKKPIKEKEYTNQF